MLSCLFRNHLLKSRVVMAASVSTTTQFKNRLANEKSPYLLQHASNPVDWYPWGQDAFDRAKKDNKMIFLSIGYSTCHWCHVMEKESFENEEIGKVMNESFVNIKIDREERPDVDRVYMNFLQTTKGGGGWPLSVWLTPSLQPLVAGTYYPRETFLNIIRHLSQSWQQDKQEILTRGQKIVASLTENSNRLSQLGRGVSDWSSVKSSCLHSLIESFDNEFGGFGSSPKFPQPVNLNFLFRYYGLEKDTDNINLAKKIATFTLDCMAKGGIYDHINLGFHRYSTDQRWHVPHFEKMLYDQAQLAVAYATAYLITKDQFYARITREILQYVKNELYNQRGGFYSAQDADSYPEDNSPGMKEGAFCVWTWKELKATLTDDKEFQIFTKYYGCEEEGNVNPDKDPHQELKDQNVLLIDMNLEDLVQEGLASSTDQIDQILESCRKKLAARRVERPKPRLDSKILTSWNGLMISAFARAGQSLSDDAFIDTAETGLDFIKEHLYDKETKQLIRTVYGGVDGQLEDNAERIPGFVEDYSNVIRALIDTYECRGNREDFLQWAVELQQMQDSLFWDEENGGYFGSIKDDPSIIIRMKQDQDGAEPNPNSVSVENLLRLAAILNDSALIEKAERVIKAFSIYLERAPIALPEMIAAYMAFRDSPTQIVICGDPSSTETQSLLQTIHQFFIANRVIIVVNPSVSWITSQVPQFTSMVAQDGKPTVYICKDFSCQLPITSLDDLHAQLTQITAK